MVAKVPLLSPEDAVYARAARLLAVQHATAEICGGRKLDADPEALREAVLVIRRIVRGIEGAHATFIGGLAVQNLGYERWTDDIDVVVDFDHFPAVLDQLRASGFVITHDWCLQNKDTGAKVDLLREGTTLRDAKFPLPHPRELGPNLGFATLPSVIRLKLDARRRQDLADVVAILKSNLDKISDIRSKLPPVMLPEFDLLADEARREARP